MKLQWISLLMVLPLCLAAQAPVTFTQPESGPGSPDYPHAEVNFQDYASSPDGYWLFEPAAPVPDSAPVVVFIHGYGAINPMIYGKWIRHIVQRGNIVIYPRYQRNLLSPRPKKFGDHTAAAIRTAFSELDTGQHVRPSAAPLILVGHSYGGVVAADLGVNYEAYEIPRPGVLMLCAPGSGPLKGGRLEHYGDMPVDTRLLVVISQGDHVVGDEFGRLVFETAVQTPRRNLIRQFEDEQGDAAIGDGHNECYSIDEAFDTGLRNLSTRRALNIARLDAVDYHGYWKLLDALMDCTWKGTNCHYAFGATPEQSSLGAWNDGTPIRPMQVIIPED